MRLTSFQWLSPTLTVIGRKLGIDAHYFAKNSMLLVAGHIVNMIRGLVAGYLVARFFEKEMYGEYQFILSISGTLAVFGFPGLITSVVRAWSRNESFSLRTVTKWHLFVCLIASAILLACIPFLQFYNRENLWPLFLAAAVLFPLPPIAQLHFGTSIVALARFDISLKAEVTWSILSIIATLLIIIFYHSSLLIFITATTIPPLVYLFYSRKMRTPTGGVVMTTATLLRSGFRLTIATFPTQVMWHIDKLMITHFFGLSQLATFSVALMIPEQIKTFAKQLLPVAFAKQARLTDTREVRRKLLKVVLVGMVFFAVGIAAYVVICPFVIPFLFPQYEAERIILLTRISAITLVTFPSSFFMQYLEAQGMIQEIQRVHWIGAITFGIAIFSLIPTYGLLGAMLARGIFRFTYLGSCWWFVMRAPFHILPKSN